MTKIADKKEQKIRRHKKIRARVSGTSDCPRIAFYKSNKYVSAQVIDDVSQSTLASASTKTMKGKTLNERVKEAGSLLAKTMKEKGIEKAVFDRGGYKYIGIVSLFADSVREGGIKF